MKPQKLADDAHQSGSHFENYADYSRTLRAWLVAYGIGGPVIFLTNEKLTDKLSKSEHANAIIFALLLGVGLQIALAVINKWCAWQMYRGAGDADYQQGWLYKCWEKINAQSWIDFTFDIASLLLFTYATWRVLSIYLVAATSPAPDIKIAISSDYLNQAGLMFGFLGAIFLAFSVKVGVVSRDGRTIHFQGLDPMDPADQNVRRVLSSHKRNRYFTPIGWGLLAAAFLLQIFATLY